MLPGLLSDCCLPDRSPTSFVMAVELAELISQLRSELSDALHAGEGSDVRFKLGPVELEVTLAVAREAKPGGKVRSGWSSWAPTERRRRAQRSGSS